MQELQETARVFTFKFDGDLEILMRDIEVYRLGSQV